MASIDIFQNSVASLLTTFVSCPQANDLFSSQPLPVHFKVGNFATSFHEFHPDHTLINLPQYDSINMASINEVAIQSLLIDKMTQAELAQGNIMPITKKFFYLNEDCKEYWYPGKYPMKGTDEINQFLNDVANVFYTHKDKIKIDGTPTVAVMEMAENGILKPIEYPELLDLIFNNKDIQKKIKVEAKQEDHIGEDYSFNEKKNGKTYIA